MVLVVVIRCACEHFIEQKTRCFGSGGVGFVFKDCVSSSRYVLPS
jgi:hypothetical protein